MSLDRFIFRNVQYLTFRNDFTSTIYGTSYQNKKIKYFWDSLKKIMQCLYDCR